MRLHLRPAASLLLYFFLPAIAMCRAAGQSASATGGLSGVVADSSSAVIPGAAVDAESLLTGTTLHARTDRSGEFLLPDLAPGEYRLHVYAAGFADLSLPAVRLELGRTARLSVVLAPARVLQAGTVTAEPPSATSTAEDQATFASPTNGNLSPAELSRLPLDGRRFQSFAALTPLASAEDAAPSDAATDANAADDAGAGAGDTDNVRISFRGSDPSGNLYLLDGLGLTRLFDGEPRGGRTLPFTVAQEGVREFQVRASGEGPMQPGDAGGTIQTVTRQGESALHGSAFFLLRSSGVGAANPFAISTRYNAGSPVDELVKPRDLRQQFGGSLGGPLPVPFPGSFRRTPQHSRLFGFLAVEAQRRSFPAMASPSDPAFYRLTATQTALLANRGVSTAATARALSFLDGLAGRVDRRADETTVLPRIDWQAGGRTALDLLWSRVRFRSPSGQRSQPVVPRGRASFGDLVTHTDTVLLHGAAALSARWLLESRAGWSRDAAFAEVATPLPSEPHTGPAGAVPEVNIAGSFTFGNAAALGARRLPEEFRTEGLLQAIFTGRAHTVTLGADVSGMDERIGSRGASSGAYEYSSGATGGRAGGLVDFLTDFTFSASSYPNGGCPSVFATVHLFCFRSFTQSFGSVPETRFHTADFSGFAADSWRATPNLLLTAGVRLQSTRLPPAQHPNAALDGVLAALTNDFATTSSLPGNTARLAPHLGLAYAAGAHTVLRLQYGMHFGRVPGRTVQAALEDTAQPASQSRLRLTPRTVIDPACASAGTNFGYPATYSCQPFGPVAANGSATVFARGFRVPAVQTGEISATRSLPGAVTLSASYVFALSRQLQNTTDLNIAPSTATVAFSIVRNGGEPGARGGQVFHVPLYTARRSSAYGSVTAVLSNATGTYNAAALQLERRSRAGLTARLSYTWSKALDTVRSSGPVPNEDAQFDPFDPLYDRARSNFDRTHRVVGALAWQPQLRGAAAWLRAAGNGWSLASVVLLTSGRPFSYGIVGGSSLPGGRDSLNGSGGANFLPSIGRNTLNLPWTRNVDLRLSRSVPLLRERAHLRAQAEVFNLLNHVNVTAVEQRAFLPGSPSGGVLPLVFQDAGTMAAEGLTGKPFGVPTSSADSPTRERRLQAGLRVEW